MGRRRRAVINSSAADDLVINAVISGAGSSNLNFTGNGATLLNGASTFSSNLILDQGTVRVSADNNLGPLAIRFNSQEAPSA